MKPSSLPTRGAWIEIPSYEFRRFKVESLPTRGAWIEIISQPKTVTTKKCRSPHGERGLK